MSDFYRPQRTRNLFNPESPEAYRISRNKIELFQDCPRCFYLDRRKGVGRINPPGYSLNSAVDTLLKKEFDVHRAAGTPHPLMRRYGIDAVPFAHDRLEEWRDALRGGVTHLHGATNLLVTGGIDDAWKSGRGWIHVVDYKSTSKKDEPTLDAPWQIGYKRQAEIYQWLFERNGFDVEPVAYFVYCNGQTDREAFDARLEFDVTVLPYTGDWSWVDGAMHGIKACLMSDNVPPAAESCDWCAYRAAVSAHLQD